MNKKEILLEKATDKEILAESLKRRGIEVNDENLKKWKLMLMDVETIEELKRRMTFQKITKTEIGGIK
jgi:hypothetical protein